MKNTFKSLVIFGIVMMTTSCFSQSMVNSIKTGSSSLVFVSSKMPRQQLLNIAREAGLARAVMVFRGFPRSGAFNEQQSLIAGLNSECCVGGNTPKWMVHPKMFDQYGIKDVPTFVIQVGDGTNNEPFSSVSGDISLSQALKFFAQRSSAPSVKAAAKLIYTRAFTGSM